MTILFVTHYSSMYGANRSLIDLITGLKQHNVKCTVVIPERGEICYFLDDSGISYTIQKFRNWVYRPQDFSGTSNIIVRFLKKMKLQWNVNKSNNRSINELRLHLEGKVFDMVYSNSSVFDFGYNLALKLEVPHVWHLREVHEHYNFRWLFSKNKVCKSFNSSQKIFAISKYVKENYAKTYDVKNIIVEYDSVLSKKKLFDLDRVIDKKAQNDSTIITFGMVSLIHKNKGQIEALEALRVVREQYPNIRLILAGLGDTSEIEKFIQGNQLDNEVRIVGHLLDPFEAFIQMDIYLMCSRMEGLGRVTLEAMASRLPIIGYDEGGTSELIVNDINGLFYRNGHEELASKMIYLIENPAIRQEMGNNGRLMFEKAFTNDIYSRNMFHHLNDIFK